MHFKAKNKAFSAFVPPGAQRQGTEAEKALFLALKCAFQPFQHSLSAAEKLARHTTSYVTNIVCYITFILVKVTLNTLIPHYSRNLSKYPIDDNNCGQYKFDEKQILKCLKFVTFMMYYGPVYA